MPARAAGPRTSRALQIYFRHVHPPLKFRIWSMARRVQRNARLRVAYAGGWITVDENDWLQRLILHGDEYESEVWSSLARFARKDEIVWDVGAYVGTFAIPAGLDPRVREVHCFEPNPASIEVLRLNVGLNSGSYRCHPLALSDRAEARRLVPGAANNGGMARLDEADDTADATRVACVTADELVAAGTIPAPTLIKIDVEDWEDRVLAGASQLLETNPPKALAVEMRSQPDGSPSAPGLVRTLEQFGYSLSRIPRPDLSVMERENYLAVHATRGGTE